MNEKTSPQQTAAAAFSGIESNQEEVMVDDFTNQVKRSLSGDAPIYLNPPKIA